MCSHLSTTALKKKTLSCKDLNVTTGMQKGGRTIAQLFHSFLHLLLLAHHARRYPSSQCLLTQALSTGRLCGENHRRLQVSHFVTRPACSFLSSHFSVAFRMRSLEKQYPLVPPISNKTLALHCSRFVSSSHYFLGVFHTRPHTILDVGKQRPILPAASSPLSGVRQSIT